MLATELHPLLVQALQGCGKGPHATGEYLPCPTLQRLRALDALEGLGKGMGLWLGEQTGEEKKMGSFEEELRRLIKRNDSIGFDCERDPRTKRTTMLQFSDEHVVLIYRPITTCNELPQCVIDLLQSTTVRKFFVDSKQDCEYILNNFKVSCKAVIDLQDEVREFGFGKPSLIALAQYFLHVNVPKNKDISVSFHESSYESELTSDQEKYAAVDAMMTHQVGQKVALIKAMSEVEQAWWVRKFTIVNA